MMMGLVPFDIFQTRFGTFENELTDKHTTKIEDAFTELKELKI